MRVEGSIKDALVMTKKRQESTKDKGVFYCRIGIVKDEELGEMRCTQEVYDLVEKMNSYDFGFIFNSEYGSLQIDRVLHGYGKLSQRAELDAAAAAVAAVPALAEEKKEAEAAPAEPAPDAEKKEEASATATKPSKK